MEEPKRYKGTTTVGIVCRDGVILASERRATLGYFIATRESEKVFEIESHIGLTTAGTAADGQALVRILRVETKLFRTRSGRSIGVEAATSLLSNTMYQYKMVPFIAQIIIGGVDPTSGPKLYSIDPLGSTQSETKYSVSGSGTPMAYAILDDAYEEGKDVKEMVPLAVRAIGSAMKRDIFSGDGIDVVTITKEGFRRYKKEELDKMVEREKEAKKKK